MGVTYPLHDFVQFGLGHGNPRTSHSLTPAEQPRLRAAGWLGFWRVHALWSCKTFRGKNQTRRRSPELNEPLGFAATGSFLRTAWLYSILWPIRSGDKDAQDRVGPSLSQMETE